MSYPVNNSDLSGQPDEATRLPGEIVQGTGFPPCAVGRPDLLDALPDFAMLVDSEHTILFANRAVCLATDLAPDDIVGACCTKAIHGMVTPFPGCPLEESVAKGCLAVQKDLHDERNGRWFHSAVYPTVETTPKGNPIFLHLVRDITEAKLGEEESARNFRARTALDLMLRHSMTGTSLEEALTSILDELLSIPWLELQKKGAILILDEQTRNLRMAASIGMSSVCLDSCRSVPSGTCLCGRVVETGTIVFAEELDDRHDVRYDGISPHGHYCIPLNAGGRTVGVLTTYLDAGHVRSKAEEMFLLAVADVVAGIIERERSEKRFRAVFDGSNDAVMLLTQDGFFDCNPRTLEMFEFATRDEFIRTHPADISPPFQPDGRESYPAAVECIQTAFETGSHRFEWAHRRRGGEEFIVDVALSAFDFSGRRVLQATVRDITERKRADEQRTQTLAGIIQAISLTVEVRDPYTAGHQRRVSAIAKAIATELALPPHDIEGIGTAGLVHDLGKIAVPSEILSKPSRLSAAEMELVKAHVRTSFEILKGIEFPWPIAEMAFQHHERIDGSGYPRGLKGGQITFGARILCVADVVEAMSSHRPYRPALGIDKALEEIEAHKGTFYDADVADTCLRLFRVKGFRIPP